MRYTGGGTKIGAALTRALSYTTGDRPGVQTVVVVVTDGKSSDDPRGPAESLRARGHNTLVLGIEGTPGSRFTFSMFGQRGRSGGSNLDNRQMLDIAGSPDRVFKVCDFSRLDRDLIGAMSAEICSRKIVDWISRPCGTVV